MSASDDKNLPRVQTPWLARPLTSETAISGKPTQRTEVGSLALGNRMEQRRAPFGSEPAWQPQRQRCDRVACQPADRMLARSLRRMSRAVSAAAGIIRSG